MVAEIERDPVTGVRTTGHEWDGIRELNNPLPKWWLNVFYASILFSILWWILYPSWPTLTGHTDGLLGSDQRLEVQSRLAEARAAQQQWLDQLAAKPLDEIKSDPQLLNFAIVGGQASFNTNCAPCHAVGGAGQGFFPTLADDDWIWGGSLEQVEQTIRHGIRNDTYPDARMGVMPAFGQDGILTKEQIRDVTQAVLAFSGAATDEAAATRGATVYEENCASCHGPGGEGVAELGAPRLSDAIWLYGSTAAAIEAQIGRPRQGVMPGWQGRIPEDSIKMLAVYVHSLGGGQ